MVRQIDSDALGILTKSLGLTGPGEQGTELFDGTVDQVLSIGDAVRRGRTQQGTDGIYTATMRNVNVDANTITNTVEPYNQAAALILPPWPNPMPAQFDIWLLQASIRQVSGSGTLSATLSVRYPGSQGWSRTSGGGAVGVAQAHRLALWDALVSDGTTFGILAGSGQPTAEIHLRLARGGATELIFITTSSLTSTWDCQLTLGVFPVALGQDGVA